MSKLPTYGDWAKVPDHLKTKTGLGKMGLRLKRGQEPVAIKTHWHYSIDDYDLYDINEAIPKRTMSQAQKKALAKAQAASEAARTCKGGCGFVAPLKWGVTNFMCDDCKLHRKIKRAYDLAVSWAREVLADEQAIILDTETTGLDSDDQALELSIIDIHGNVLLNTLLKPTCEISIGALNVHGIGWNDLETAPTMADIYEQVKAIFDQASRVVIYNANYDTYILQNSCEAYSLPPLFEKAECAMEAYARFYGEWSDYWGSFTWQRLNGGHRALGDCRACLNLIKEMAEAQDLD